MKKIRFILMLLLISILIDTEVLAEMGYVNIKNAISQSAGTGFSIEIEELPDGQIVTILFYPWKNEIVLCGKNEENLVEGTCWNTELCTQLFGGYCGSWDALVDSLDNDYRLNIILQTAENGELLLIDSAEKASVMYQAILENK